MSDKDQLKKITANITKISTAKQNKTREELINQVKEQELIRKKENKQKTMTIKKE